MGGHSRNGIFQRDDSSIGGWLEFPLAVVRISNGINLYFDIRQLAETDRYAQAGDYQHATYAA